MIMPDAINSDTAKASVRQSKCPTPGEYVTQLKCGAGESSTTIGETEPRYTVARQVRSTVPSPSGTSLR
jgi:hypothetical protein